MQFVIAQEPGSERWLVLQLLHHLIGDHTTLEILQAEVEAMLRGRGDELAAPQPFRNLVAQARLGVSAEEHERVLPRAAGGHRRADDAVRAARGARRRQRRRAKRGAMLPAGAERRDCARRRGGWE